MFDKNNLQKNIHDLCKYLGIILITIIALVVFWITTVGIGLGVTHSIYGHAYNMTSGISLFPGNTKTILCFNDYHIALFGGCALYGLVTWLIFILFMVLCIIVIVSFYGLYCCIPNDKKIKQLIEQIFSHWSVIVIAMILKVNLLYFSTGGLGLGFMYMIFGHTYNITSGWPLSNNYSEGPLMCCNMNRPFFVGCIPSGILVWIIIVIGSIIVIFVVCIITIICSASYYYCWVKIITSYIYIRQLIHDSVTNVQIRFNERTSLFDTDSDTYYEAV